MTFFSFALLFFLSLRLFLIHLAFESLGIAFFSIALLFFLSCWLRRSPHDQILIQEVKATAPIGSRPRLRQAHESREEEAECLPRIAPHARRYVAGERQGHTLQTSALVNESTG